MKPRAAARSRADAPQIAPAIPWINELMRHSACSTQSRMCWSEPPGLEHLVLHQGAARPGFVSWHQDATYWGTIVARRVLGLDRTIARNKVSGLHEVHSRHPQGTGRHADTFHQDNLLTRGQEIAVEVDEAKAIYAELNPGQASLHHAAVPRLGAKPVGRSAHRLWPSGTCRRTSARPLGRATARPWFAGSTSTRTLPRSRPRVDLDPEGVAFHKAATEAQAAVLYRGTGKTAFRPDARFMMVSAIEAPPDMPQGLGPARNGPRASFGTVWELRRSSVIVEPWRFACDVNMKLRANARVVIQSTERQAIVRGVSASNLLTIGSRTRGKASMISREDL